jgi:hypothetical protein
LLQRIQCLCVIFCSLLMNAVIILKYTTSNDGVICEEWIGKGIERKRQWPNYKYYPEICLEWLTKQDDISQNFRYSGRESNRASPDYMSKALLREPSYWVPVLRIFRMLLLMALHTGCSLWNSWIFMGHILDPRETTKLIGIESFYRSCDGQSARVCRWP